MSTRKDELTADELRSCIWTFADGGINLDVTLGRINNLLRQRAEASQRSEKGARDTRDEK